MDANTSDELKRLRNEVRRLERYRRIIHGQFLLTGKMTRLVTLLWFGPTLVQAIQNIISARKSGLQATDVEIAQLIAAVLRRMLRIGLVAAFIAALPVVVLVWQNTLMRQQVIESRRHTVENIQHNRKTELLGYLSEIEATLSEMIDSNPAGGRIPLRRIMNSDDFLTKCTNDNTKEYRAIDYIAHQMISYVRFLSELYLLDIRALDPLSEAISETSVSDRRIATSPSVYWFAIKIYDVVNILVKCRPAMEPLAKFVRWNVEIDSSEYQRYMIPATDIRYKYGIAKRNVRVIKQVLVPGTPPMVRVNLAHTGPRQINDVIVTCLVSRDSSESSPALDIDSQRRNIGSLGKEDSREIEIFFPRLVNQDLNNAEVNCRIESATGGDPVVTTLK